MAHAPSGDRLGVVIVGAGGHGREIFSILVAQGRTVLGFVDDGTPDPERLARLGAGVLGPVATLAQLTCSFVVGVGSEAVRRSIRDRVASFGARATSVVHPFAAIGPDVEWGVGFVAFANSSITTNVRLGDHVHVKGNATLAHDSRVGDFVTVGPGATVAGNVTIGDEVLIGAGATVVQGINIGARAVVGAGAVVVDDVPPGITVVGVPARPLEHVR